MKLEKESQVAFLVCSQSSSRLDRKRMPKWTVLIKAGLYYKPTQIRKQGNRESLQRAQTYKLENILRVEIPTQTIQVEKNGKQKKSKKPLPRLCLGRNGHD